MNEPVYKYYQKEKSFFIKITGRATYELCDGFREFLKGVFDKKLAEEILIDLTEAEYLDSTNLGLLARIAVYQKENCESAATIISTNGNITQLIKTMGLDQLFILLDDNSNSQKDWVALANKQFKTRDDLNMALLETHSQLMQLNNKNKSEFKDVVTLLKKQTEKSK